MAFIEPLNLEQLLINTFAGGTVMFGFLTLIFLAGLAGHFKMSNSTTLLLLYLFIAIMTPILAGLQGFYMVLVAIAGLIIALSVNRLVR